MAYAGAWFSPARWSRNDLIMAVASVAMAVSVFVRWFSATLKFGGGAPVTGFLLNFPGTGSGVSFHRYLWAVVALALLQLAILAARYVPNGRGFTVPGYPQFLAVTSGLSFVIALVAAVMKPTVSGGGGFSIVIGWTYGPVLAMAAAIVSGGVAIATSRNQPVTSPSWR
jgi:phosphoglycerol transferase MdoB-like AlkP superfamily enzyme